MISPQNCGSVSSESDHFPSLSFKPCCSYTDVSKLASELKQQLEKVFDEEISKTLNKGKVLKGYFKLSICCIWLYVLVMKLLF